MKSFINAVETFAALILLFMALLTSSSAFTRYIFSKPIPDEYDISRLCLGIVACWGMAAAFRHREHIQLEIFWSQIKTSSQRTLTRIGSAICLGAIGFFSWALLVKIYDTFQSNLETLELGLPIWAFYVPAWIGTLASSIVLIGEIVAPGEEGPSPDEMI